MPVYELIRINKFSTTTINYEMLCYGSYFIKIALQLRIIIIFDKNGGWQLAYNYK
jgi:hypothetical protein